jgi:hypothetical protein
MRYEMVNIRRFTDEEGSVLMLMPAAVLIVMVLGAIGVDLSVVRMGQRELIAAAGDAANDAVTVGLDEAALRAGDGYHLDGETTVTVQLARRVPHLFAKALPGAPDDQLVRATVTAEVEQR